MAEVKYLGEGRNGQQCGMLGSDRGGSWKTGSLGLALPLVSSSFSIEGISSQGIFGNAQGHLYRHTCGQEVLCLRVSSESGQGCR